MHLEPAKYRKGAYTQQAQDSGVFFFFDDEGIEVELYTVPYMEVFARDDYGGYFTRRDGGDEGIYYIVAKRECFWFADSFQNFVELTAQWRKHLKNDRSVRVFASWEDAQREFEIVDLDIFLSNWGLNWER